MEESFVLATQVSYLLKGLNDSDFVIDVDHRADESVGSQGFLEFLDIQDSVGLHWQVGDFESFVLESAASVKDALVLNLSSYYMFLLVSVELSYTLKTKVVALGGTTCENYLFVLGSNQLGYIVPGSFDRLLGIPPELVRLGVRIAEVVGQEGKHPVEHSRVHWGGGLEIEVERHWSLNIVLQGICIIRN